nr:uncharacterized protein LOC117683178 [Crassostrea gigas]
METASAAYKVRQCSACPGTTEYYCEVCPCDLCKKCKENKVMHLKTIDHNVMTFRDKSNNISEQEFCVRHPRNLYRMYCEYCQVPVCDFCFGHKYHKIISTRELYETKRQQHRGTIHTIRSEVIFYRLYLLTKARNDIKTVCSEFSFYQSGMLTKAQKLMDFINDMQKDSIYNVFGDFDFKHRCLEQKIEMNRHIVSLQRYVQRYEKSAIRPLHFLLSIKTILRQTHLTLHTSQLSMTESLKKEDVMESLSGTNITERRNQRVGNEYLLKLMSAPWFHQSCDVEGVDGCHHISCVTSNQVWVSDVQNLILKNTKTFTSQHVKNLGSDDIYIGDGSHTVNNDSQLIYIDEQYTIKKLSKNMKTSTTFVEHTSSFLRPRCVFWSLSTETLLVGMYIEETRTGEVARYNKSGQLTQTILHDNTGRELFRYPSYITENNNGDVVVSDFDAVVVTERGGRHRFSYTGHPSGSGILPHGICTGALSHILVCDDATKTVQMIDRDGQFLSHLLIRPSGIFRPQSLGYDVNTHRLFVGSWYNNKICVFRYIDRRNVLTNLNPDIFDGMESRNGTNEREKPQQQNECLLKLFSSPELLHSFRVPGVRHCYHISCISSKLVWVSDDHNFILTNTTGDTQCRVKDLCRYLNYSGLHTVNSEGELIYIDRMHNINKLSNDMETTIFLRGTKSTWKPRCVYWSLSTGDLLVGMFNYPTRTGMITRYNKSRQHSQTIEYDNTGLELYREPNYITENNNGDVVVSDYVLFESGAVVVTERGGRHRFSYTGHPSGSGLQPRGICTDALSHILVCDGKSNTVQMIDRDGQFLSHLLIRPPGTFTPWGLGYDVNTHHLFIGSEYNNKLHVYRYIHQQEPPTDEFTHFPDGDVVSNSKVE